MNKKSKKLLSNTFLFFIGNLGSKFIQFFLVPLYTYTLTTIEYGTTDLIFTTINFLMPIFSLQVSDALLRYGLDKNINQKDTLNVCFKILFIGSCISICISPIMLFIESMKDYIFYFIILLNLKNYRDIFSIVLKIEDKNKIYAIDSIIYTFVLCFLSFIFLAIFKTGINGYFCSYIIASLISICYIYYNINFKLKNTKDKMNPVLLKQIIIYSLPMIVNSLSYWITTASDRYMLGIFVNVSFVGIYAVATKIPTIFTTFTSIFNQAWLLSSINEYETDRDSKFYSTTFNYYTGISFVVCTFLIAIIKPFMSLYVSSNYFIAWKSSILLIISAVFSGICAFINSIFYAYKKNVSATITTLIGAISNIILNSLLIPKYDVMGASIATLISWITIAISRIISVQKIFTMKINYFKIIVCSLLLFLEVLILLFLSNKLIISSILIIAILIMIIIIYRDVIMYILKYFYNLIKKVKKKLK